MGIDASYTKATETMDAVDLSAPADILEKLHWSSYDFSELHLYSNLNSDMIDLTMHAEARLTDKLSGTFSASYIDVTDNTPYIEDLTGNLSIYTLGLRWGF